MNITALPPKIAILTPGPIGSNPRVVKEAQALHDAGYRVTVVSTRTLSEVDALDQSVLAKNGWQSVRLDFRHKLFRLPRRLSQSAFARAFAATGYASFAARGISLFVGALFAKALSCEADLYIGHYPAGLVAAAWAAKRRRVSFAFDAEDFHFGDYPPGPAYDLERRLVRAIEEKYVAGCAYVTAASPGIADAYTKEYGVARPTVVLNVFPLQQAPLTATPRGEALPGPSVYWFSQTIGPGRGLECAARAIGLAESRPHLYLRGSPVPGFSDRLRAIASELQAGDRLHVLPTAAPAEMERLASQYDVGLSSEPGHTINNKIALGNKVFSFLLAGVPIVASDVLSHRNFQTDGSSAFSLYSVGNADALAAALDGMLLAPEKLAGARAHAFMLGQTRFNWDAEKMILMDLVSHALSLPSASATAL